MSIGEIISALSLCASDSDDNRDSLLMLRSVCRIEVEDDGSSIAVYFVDGNTPDIRIHKDGAKEVRRI